jgi:hypothetical protein
VCLLHLLHFQILQGTARSLFISIDSKPVTGIDHPSIDVFVKKSKEVSLP